MPPKPSTRRRSGRAAAKPDLSLKRPRRRRLRRRVVTQLAFFFGGFVSSAGLFRIPREFAAKPGLLLLRRLSPGRAERRGS
jgi:hypothetical protein